MNRFTYIWFLLTFPCLIPSALATWLSPDPLLDKYPYISPYAYCNWNPMKYTDPDGKEPNKVYMGSSSDFKTLMDNSPHKVGLYTGNKAAIYMGNLGNTKIDFSHCIPKIFPAETGFFNNRKGRYIYTKKGGWIDMAHFMFYAGLAYKYKLKGASNPVNIAVQRGYWQEKTDKIFAPHSAYSYEDLPTDYFGAVFGGEFFDPQSHFTLGEQLKQFLDNELEATIPSNAPNFETLPQNDNRRGNKPSFQNKTTKPIYTDE